MAGPITVQGPDGQRYEFPEGTDPSVMKQAMAKRYPKPETSTQPASPFLQKGMDMVSAAQAGPRTVPNQMVTDWDRAPALEYLAKTLSEDDARKAERKALDERAAAAGDVASAATREGSMDNPGAYALSGFAGFGAGRDAGNEVYDEAGVIPQDSAFALHYFNTLGLPGILNKDYRAALAQANEDQPGAAMGGTVASLVQPGMAAWDATRGGVNALARNFTPRGSGVLPRLTRWAAPTAGAVAGTAAQNAYIQGAVFEPVRAEQEGREYTLEGAADAAAQGLADPINAAPLGLSAVNRTWNALTSGIATPSRKAADMLNQFGVGPRRSTGSEGIGSTVQQLGGQVQPADVRGITNIENALRFALRDNPNIPDVNTRIADGFERIRQSLPLADDPSLNLARLIEREFAEDAPQTRDIIRRFLSKVGQETPGGEAIVGGAANDIRGRQADVLEQEAMSVFGDQPKTDAKQVLQQNLDLLGEQTYGPIVRQAQSAPPQAQQRAAGLLNRRPETEDILFNRADREGLTVQQYIARNPLEALHWVQSDLAKQARALRGANNPDTALEGVIQNMKTVLRDNVPSYREADALYASNAQAFDRLGTTRGADAGTQGELKYDPGFGERLLGGGGSAPAATRAEGRATARTVYDSMDEQSRRSAAISVRDIILDDLSKARAAGVDQRYEIAAKFQKLNSEGALQALVDVFGEEGQRIVRRIRQFVDANEFASAIDPLTGSNTMNKAQAMQTGAQPFAGSMGQATQSAAGSLGQNAVGDAFMMATGITSAPVLSALRFVPWVANRLQPGQRTQQNIAQTLLRQTERGANVPALPRPPPPIVPVDPSTVPPRGGSAPPNALAGGQRVDAPANPYFGRRSFRSDERGSVTGDAASGLAYGSAGGVSGNFVDYNQDGRQDWQDVGIGAGVGALGGAGLNRVGGEIISRLPKGQSSRLSESATIPEAAAVLSERFKPRAPTRAATEQDWEQASKEAFDLLREQARKQDGFEPGVRVRQEKTPDSLTDPNAPPRFVFEDLAERILRSRGIDPDPVYGRMLSERPTNAETDVFRKAAGHYAGKARANEREGMALDGMDETDAAIERMSGIKPPSRLNGIGAGLRGDLGTGVAGAGLGAAGPADSNEERARNALIGFGIGAGGSRLSRTGANAFASGARRTVGAPRVASAGVPKTPAQAAKFETPGSPEWEAAKAKGLDMSQAGRMARAKEMGFDTDTVLYHGTGADIKAFNPDAGTGARAETGTWLSSSPQNASTYSPRIHPRRDTNGAVYPLVIKGKNIVTVDVRGKNWARLDDTTQISVPSRTENAQDDLDLLAALGQDISRLSSQRSISEKRTTLGDIFGRYTFDESAFSTNDIAQWARKKGYDGVKFIGVKDQGGFSDTAEAVVADTYVIFDPSNIRSVNAAFDPDKAGSSTLLAAAPIIAAGGGIGIAAQQEKRPRNALAGAD